MPAPPVVVAAATLLIVVLLMLGEAWWSRRNEQRLRSRGAVEASNDVYGLMRLAYPAAFLVMTIEGAAMGTPRLSRWLAGAGLFLLSKALKYWAIAALGERWTFRVFSVPGAPLVTAGPYRVLRHPNYVAVAGEFVGMAVMLAAWISGGLGLLGFGLLLWRRILVEERALGLR